MRIQKMAFLSVLVCLGLMSHAQRYPYSGQYLGWTRMVDPNAAEKPYTVDHRQYSVRQMEISRMIVTWLQQSYTPKGAIGQAFKLVNNKIGPNTQHTRSAPQCYGATTKTLIELRQNAQGKWEPYTNTNWFIDIAINGLIGNSAELISTPEQYYFFIPGEERKFNHHEELETLLGFSTHSALEPYYHWFQPKSGSSTLQYVVLLCKDKVKPYLQITKGEYIEALGRAIEKDAKEKYTWIAEEKARNSKYEAYNTEQQLEKRKAAYKRLKEKYRNRLEEPARLISPPSLHLEGESGFDVFENPNYTADYLVYKFDPEKLNKTSSDTPQWVLISWDAEGVATQEEAGTHLHRSMLENIDYNYIYNYFFDPSKVKGTAYKPLQSPTFEEKVVAQAKSARAIKAAADASVIFYDDFSTTPAGKSPLGWRSTLNGAAQPAVVKQLDGVDGNWVELKGQRIYAQSEGKALPEDFIVSYDIAVRKDFPWGSPGVECYLAGDRKYEGEYGRYVMVSVKPGFNERDGWATVNIKMPGQSFFPGEVAVPGFSNNRPVNQTTVRIEKKGERIQIFVGATKVFDQAKAMPKNLTLDQIYFRELHQGSALEEFYVSNVRVTK